MELIYEEKNVWLSYGNNHTIEEIEIYEQETELNIREQGIRRLFV